MGVRYLFRLDDACPHHDRQRWQRVEDLFDCFGVKPLVAVIPHCQDPDLLKFPVDNDFWQRARAWVAKGWPIALHGFEHQFHTRQAGLVPLNRYSEFAGLPLENQRAKIKQGYAELLRQQLSPQFFVAPAHSFDRATLEALAMETPIRLISDGLAQSPFRRFGFTWIPQQLWRPRTMRNGTWTICLHPNEMSEADFQSLETFLKNRPAENFDWLLSGNQVRSHNLLDAGFGLAFRLVRTLRRLIRLNHA